MENWISIRMLSEMKNKIIYITGIGSAVLCGFMTGFACSCLALRVRRDREFAEIATRNVEFLFNVLQVRKEEMLQEGSHQPS